jgi:hypothetical protein
LGVSRPADRCDVSSLTRSEAYLQFPVDFWAIRRCEAVNGGLVLAVLFPLAFVAMQIAVPVARPGEGKNGLTFLAGELLRRHQRSFGIAAREGPSIRSRAGESRTAVCVGGILASSYVLDGSRYVVCLQLGVDRPS